LLSFFSEFGSIVDLSIIRDKFTNAHKGCAFLTYSNRLSALKAVEELHDKVKLPNSTNLLQVRRAENQSEKENKLFVGMLPKTMDEDSLNLMFSSYGTLKEVYRRSFFAFPPSFLNSLLKLILGSHHSWARWTVERVCFYKICRQGRCICCNR